MRTLFCGFCSNDGWWLLYRLKARFRCLHEQRKLRVFESSLFARLPHHPDPSRHNAGTLQRTADFDCCSRCRPECDRLPRREAARFSGGAMNTATAAKLM